MKFVTISEFAHYQMAYVQHKNWNCCNNSGDNTLMKTVKVSVRKRISSLPRRSAARWARGIMFGSIPPENNMLVKLGIDAEKFCVCKSSVVHYSKVHFFIISRGLIKAPGTSLLAASKPEYLRASVFTLWAMIYPAVRIGAAESDDRFAGAAYSSQRQVGQVRCCF